MIVLGMDTYYPNIIFFYCKIKLQQRYTILLKKALLKSQINKKKLSGLEHDKTS